MSATDRGLTALEAVLIGLSFQLSAGLGVHALRSQAASLEGGHGGRAVASHALSQSAPAPAPALDLDCAPGRVRCARPLPPRCAPRHAQAQRLRQTDELSRLGVPPAPGRMPRPVSGRPKIA